MSSPQSPPTEPSPDRKLMEAVLMSFAYHDLLGESHLVPPKELGIPLKQLFPEDWNWHFESAYQKKYGLNADIQAWKDENMDLVILGFVGDLRACCQLIALSSQILLRVEGELIALAMDQLVDGDFEAKWVALQVETKQDYVLDGLVRAAFKVPEESRFDCPEMSLFGLIGDEEYNLINLLKAIIAHDPSGNLRVKSLYLFSHPGVSDEYPYTRENAPDDFRASCYLSIVKRNLYIVATLTGILEAYAGKPAPNISAKEEMDAKQQAGCHSCNASSTEDKPLTLRKCSGCKLVWYCSSECQHRDWRAHKKICRTSHEKFDPALLTPTPEEPAEFIGCPAPVAGFARSPALWRQIWYLSNKDSYARDYHFDTTPGCTRSIRIPNPVYRLTFLIARRRAMATGDRGAVCKMYDVLARQQLLGYFNLTAAQIRGQLEREYRVALSPRAPFGPLPTMQETLEELRYVANRDRLADARAEGEGDLEAGEYDPADVLNEWEFNEADADSSEESEAGNGSEDDDIGEEASDESEEHNSAKAASDESREDA
ncbi:hypothetical protein C8R43DRAFT_1159390 [Mycena crocata]|nr:hypothetical protein C8R43DRAFT_1159390 [Mycena crocata]